MKLRAVLGWTLCGAWFVFATYVSITGGPNLKNESKSPDYDRVAQIAASAKQSEAHADGCCSKKQKAGETETAAHKGGCAGQTDHKCEHH